MLRPPSDFYEYEDSDACKLEVKQSTLPVGEGLFATQAIAEGEMIGEYRGIVIEATYCNHEYYATEDKMVSVNSKYCVLGRTSVAKANDIIRFEPQNYETAEFKEHRDLKKVPDMPGLERNAQIQMIEKDRVFLVATRNIAAGAEIFTAYGFEYWDFFLSRAYESNHKPI